MKLFACDRNLNPSILSPDPLYYTAPPSLNSSELYAAGHPPVVGESIQMQPGSRKLSSLGILSSKLNEGIIYTDN